MHKLINSRHQRTTYCYSWYQRVNRKEMANCQRVACHREFRYCDKKKSGPGVPSMQKIHKSNWERKNTALSRGNFGSPRGETNKQIDGDEPAKCIHKMGGCHVAESHMDRHLAVRLSSHLLYNKSNIGCLTQLHEPAWMEKDDHPSCDVCYGRRTLQHILSNCTQEMKDPGDDTTKFCKRLQMYLNWQYIKINVNQKKT